MIIIYLMYLLFFLAYFMLLYCIIFYPILFKSFKNLFPFLQSNWYKLLFVSLVLTLSVTAMYLFYLLEKQSLEIVSLARELSDVKDELSKMQELLSSSSKSEEANKQNSILFWACLFSVSVVALLALILIANNGSSANSDTIKFESLEPLKGILKTKKVHFLDDSKVEKIPLPDIDPQVVSNNFGEVLKELLEFFQK